MKTALIFIHGWMGNSQWWKHQCDHFRNSHIVAALDLPGHGNSPDSTTGYSSTLYAQSIKDFADTIAAENLILVGHSMGGAYALEASLIIPRVKGVVLVDTVKNLEQSMTIETAEQVMFAPYRKDYKGFVENILPKFLFTEATPSSVKEMLIKEFLKATPDKAVDLLSPLYRMEIQSIAKKVSVPVRAINSEYTPTNVEANRKFLKDYGNFPISETGHYPMLEDPARFNRILESVIKEF